MMCQATVYLIEDGQEREILRDVILMEPTESGWRLQALFEEPQEVQARVERLDFLRHTVTLVAAQGGSDVDNVRG
jgi:predicted RNA-binding protein